MKVYLDSTDNLKTILRIDDKEYIKEVTSPREQNVFGFLKECLAKEGSSLRQVTEIQVNPGPGSFTGSRVGVTIANAIAFSLGIKVNGKEAPLEVVYSAPPSITTPKPKN